MDELTGIANEAVAIVLGGVAIYLATLARTYVARKVAETDGFLDEGARLRLEAAIGRAIAIAEEATGSFEPLKAVKYLKEFNGGDIARFPALTDAALRTRILATKAENAK